VPQFIHRLARLSVSLAITVGLCSASTIFSFSGAFTFDSDVRYFTVTAATLSIGVRTYSYGGGVNGVGQNILEGGFAPSIALYDSTGVFIAADTLGGTFVGPGCSNGTTPYSVTKECLDIKTVFAIPPLQATGVYFVALSQQGNDAPQTTLIDQFPFPADTDFFPPAKFPDPVFFNLNGTVLGPSWAVDFTVGDADTVVPEVPEPASCVLTLIGLLGLAARKRWHA